MKSVLISCVLIGLFLSGGCASPWSKYDTSLYTTVKEATPEAIEQHILLLDEIIIDAEKEGRSPPPGICAEYGYYMAVQGKLDEGIQYLDREVQYYPESTTFVTVVKRFVTNEESIFEGDAAEKENTQ